MFHTHKLNDKGVRDVARFKYAMTAVVVNVLGMMPEGREKALFTTKIEEAVFFGTKAVAGKPGNFTSIEHFTSPPLEPKKTVLRQEGSGLEEGENKS